MVLRSVRPRLALGWSQVLLTLGHRLDRVDRSPRPCPTGRSIRCCTTSPWYTFQLDMVRCLWAILPPTILWGASFPLALAALAASRRGSRARLVGSVYAANTLGAIVGALGVSLCWCRGSARSIRSAC